MKERSAPQYFELQERHACYAPLGEVSLGQATQMVNQAIRFARDQGVERLVVDLTGLAGLQSPSLPERYWIVREWAGSATTHVALSIVLQPYLIDPERFGVMVAVNLGTRADVFTERALAVAWLLSDQPSSVQRSSAADSPQDKE